MPMTLRFALTMPAISFDRAIGVGALGIAEDDPALAFEALQGFGIAD